MSEYTETEKDLLVDLIVARAPEAPAPRFPEIVGCCRTCCNAHVTRRQYSDVPAVFCQAFGQNHNRMPLDIMECSSYQKRGETSLRDMAEVAILIDARPGSGQYL
jgi:hypothetical protein